MHLAWLLYLSSIAVEGIPLGSRETHVEKFPFKDDYEACEQAANCHIVIDEDGDRVIDFIPGMGPGSEYFEAMNNGTYDDPVTELYIRANFTGLYTKTAIGIRRGVWLATNGLSSAVRRDSEPLLKRYALRIRANAIRARKTIQYMGEIVPAPAAYT